MRILHVCLGNPEAHSGGLNRYCKDLMHVQKARGDSVSIIHPGTFLSGSRPHIISAKRERYILLDGLPTAIFYGIDVPARYMRSSDIQCFQAFLSKLLPDVIHVHSIQGMPLEFFMAAKALEIPLLYTTHDFYAICFRGVFLNKAQEHCNGPAPEKCARCSCDAGLTATKQRILQSESYAAIKKIDFLRSKAAQSVPHADHSEKCDRCISEEEVEEFQKLIQYNRKIVESFSMIHCNSRLSESMYQAYFPNIRTKTLPITHCAMSKNSQRVCNRYHIGYFGGPARNKGWIELLQAARWLSQQDNLPEWSLLMYGGSFPEMDGLPDNIHFCGAFHPGESERVWDNLDIMVVPSTSVESFGFVVLEALCRGIPVIASDAVGAKDFLPAEWIYPHDQADALAEKLCTWLSPDGYSAACTALEKIQVDYDMNEHASKIDGIYQEMVGIKTEGNGIHI